MAITRSSSKRGKEPVVFNSAFEVVDEAGMIADNEEGEYVGRRLKQKSPAKKKTKKENPGATKKKITFSVDDGVDPDSDFDMGGLDGRNKSSPTKNKSKLKSKSSKRERTKVEFAIGEDGAYSKKGKMLDEIELKDYALQEGGARGKASRQSKFSEGSFFTTTTGSVEVCVPPVTNSRVSPLPPEPSDFDNPTAPIDIPVDSAVVMTSSSTDRPKIKISFYINGNPVGFNKAILMRRTLALAKSIVGLKYDGWRTVPSTLKDDLWNTLMLDFDLKNVHKKTLLSEVSGQWKTWKKNLRKLTFGDTATSKEILQLRDKPPELIPHAEWNLFVDREADPKKLEQRAKNKANRAKKTDVHLLGSKSYAQVNAEWQERTKDTKNEGLTPSRKKKFGDYHSGFATKLSEIRETQGGDIDSVPLSQIFGKNKCGRTRVVGGKVSRTKYKATQVAVSEIDQMKSEIQVQGSKIDTILSLLQGQPTEDMEAPSPATSKSIPKKPSMIGEGYSMCPKSNEKSPLKAHKGYYHIRDLKNEQNIAMAKIETMEPGAVVHSRPLKYPEAKVIILAIYPNMEDEPVYLGQQGCATCLGDFGEGSFITWPIYLLKEMT